MMGYPLSCHRPQRDLKGRKRQKGQPAIPPDSRPSDQVNINTATEEELMTLPGMNRTLAHNMVLYRNRIGGFRKIEDLALVTGVGATRLQQMRPEICVGDTGPLQSGTEVGVGATGPQARPEVGVGATGPQARPEIGLGNRGRSRSMDNLDLLSCTKLNINLASEKQLTTLLGVSEEMARRIVHHRPYRRADDLLRVTGHHAFSLTPISSRLSAALPRPASTTTTTTTPQPCIPLPSFCSLQDLSLNPGLRPRTPLLFAPHAAFTGCFGGRKVIRVGTWNLQGLNLDKVNNPGVREVICMTLLEHGIKLLAIQEVLHEDALDKVCLEFEKPTITALQEWKDSRGCWKYVVLENPPGQEEKEIERVAFLWDSSAGLELNQAVSLEVLLEQNNGNQPYNQPVLACFKMGELPLNLINVHLRANQTLGVTTGTGNKALDMDTLRPHLTEQKQLIILGHFGLQPDATEFNLLRDHHFQHCVPSDTFTNISKDKNGDVSRDNIWWNQPAQAAYTGRWGVIRQGLSNPWIPDGWKWGGNVSQHCPVWIEFFID
ncbi:endonuclease/exonuclease/phosphatase family domain-containing protein 1-like [Pristis pectinata]|uniref:endonuclease/exonuclease/phosphatase family domain-containing protein 1-like n=1 Tax=Pristis pectinata TaxID=685728 RepID=UPI00223E04A1|nr:endonuclease/exonuclease/phosphatase family domain-containing protein 1-like [Pristis pectinata]XP_051884331.1 endonuclease/exonuclease/phosphatase family domain-containing protein 1-like [Pristis pectinata]